MMLLSEIPAMPRQIMMVISFFCFILFSPFLTVFYRRKQTVNIFLSVILLVLSYLTLQSLSGVTRMLAWSYVDERFVKGAEITQKLHAFPVLILFVAMLALTVILIIIAVKHDGQKLPDVRFSNLKVHLHDTFGLSLVATKAYYNGQKIDRDTVRLLYARCRECFYMEKTFSCRTYESIYQIGKLIGVDLVIKGKLPVNETVKPVICSVLSECMINTFRHAWGNMLYVTVSDGDRTIITVQNNGKPPKEPVQEKGGLKHLRSYAESLDIDMTVESLPQFTLTLRLPKEVQHGV